MAKIDDRLAEFTTDALPGADVAAELLCRDHRGTYTIPFPCHALRAAGGYRAENAWRNSQTDGILQANVVGWRPWERETPSAP